MQHYWSLGSLHLQNTWLTIGSFDGVHRGHQHIIKELVTGAHAHNARAVVLTFYPHPAIVLGKRTGFLYLTTPEERARQFEVMGVDYVISHPFNPETAQLSPREFISKAHSHLSFYELCVGYDFALGRDRQGNISKLKELGLEFNFTVSAIQPIKVDSEIVSSRHIRSYLKQGKVERAANLLGRDYKIRGEVVPGDGRGKTLGIPTANLAVWRDQVIPAVGVYVCRAYVDGKKYGSVINIGMRPTFEAREDHPTVEAHILDFDRDLYGKRLELDFITRLRDEHRFLDVQALIDQIHDDISQARKVLSRDDGSSILS